MEAFADVSPLALTIFGGCVIAAFAGLLGFVLGNKSIKQLEIDMARIAPTLAGMDSTMKAIQSAVDSVAHGFVEHTKLAGHLGGMERLDAAEKDIDRLGSKLSRHVEDRSIHNGR